MQQKRVLGRGLDALLGSRPANVIDRREVIYKPVEFIRPSPHQPRKHFDESSIAELAESIKERGVLQPILVRPVDDHFEIVFGERRYRAALKVGLKDVPVMIINLSDSDALETALVENIHRKDLNPIEEAEAYKFIMEKFNLTQEELANRVKKSRSAVANALRLLKLPEDIRSRLISGEISEGHARALLMARTESEMQRLLTEILSDGLNVRDAEKRAQKRHISRENQPSYVVSLEERLNRYYRTKCSISIKRNKSGNISLGFSSEEDLTRLIDLLLR